MARIARPSRNVIVATLLVVLAVATLGSAQELPVTPGLEPGTYSIDLGDGGTMKLSLVVEGPPWMDDPEHSGCLMGREFRLLVGVLGSDHPVESLTVPLASACDIEEVRAIQSDDRLLFGVLGSYYGSCGRSETHLRRWIVIELRDDLRLIENAMDPGPFCYNDPWRLPKPDIEPGWQVRGDELWMSVSVRSFLCYQHGKEVRGDIEWRVGEQPEPVQFLFPDRLQELIPEIQSLGFQPFGHFSLRRGIHGLIAEIPSSIGSPRLLAIADRKGRSSITLLPQLGYEPGLREKIPNLTDPYLVRFTRPISFRTEEWPQLQHVEAFEYSEDFLSARSGVSVQPLLRNLRVLIGELSLPCVEAVDPSPTGALSERWLLRVERKGDRLEIESRIIEPCSSGELGSGGPTEYFLPPAKLEVTGDSAIVTYPPPQVDLERLAKDKFLFLNIQFLNKQYSTPAVEMRLDRPTITIPRCEPAMPTSGRGWLIVEEDVCSLETRLFPGSGRPTGWKIASDRTPPRFIEPPSIGEWCGGAEGGTERKFFHADLSENGTITGFRNEYPSGPIPDELAADINEWRLEPARDADGSVTEAILVVEVARGLPQRVTPSVCR